ncbi:hypothetical protein [Streptomyces noursei]
MNVAQMVEQAGLFKSAGVTLAVILALVALLLIGLGFIVVKIVKAPAKLLHHKPDEPEQK